MKRVLGIISLICISVLLCSADTSFAKKAKKNSCPEKKSSPITTDAAFLEFIDGGGEYLDGGHFKLSNGKKLEAKTDVPSVGKTLSKMKKGTKVSITYVDWQYKEEYGDGSTECVRVGNIKSIKRR